jgi:hypothetical protein
LALSIEKTIDILTIIFLAFITFSISITQSAFYLAVILIIFKYKKNLAGKIKDVEINTPLILFFLAAVISLIFYVEPVEPLKSAKKLKMFLIFAAYYYFIVHRPPLPKIRKYFYILMFAFGLTLLFIILQNHLGEGVIPYRYNTFQWDQGRRVYPLYGQFSSIILLIILPVLLFSKSICGKERTLLIFMLFPIFAILYLSLSRTSIISATLATCFMFLFKNKRLYLFVFLLVLFAAGSFYAARNDKNLLKSVINLTSPENPRRWSNKVRIDMLKDTEDIINKHLITGIGFNGYKNYSKKLNRGRDKIFNDYLNVLATMGLLGVIPFFWLILVLLKKNYAGIRLLKAGSALDDFFTNLSFGIFLSYLSFLINGVFEPIFFNSESLMLMLILLSMNKIIIEEAGIESKETEAAKEC